MVLVVVKMVKAICFLPEKIGPLRNAMNNKSPIKIKKFEYNDKFNNIVIKNNTAITPSADTLPFQRITSLETHMVTIATLKKTSPQQLVNLKATVKSISGSKMVKVQSGSLNKSSATLVDPTGSITAVFWQEWADCVDIDKTYIFKNLRVKNKQFFRRSLCQYGQRRPQFSRNRCLHRTTGRSRTHSDGNDHQGCHHIHHWH